ncbi:MAG: helix-turn-helix domain-containing protein [Acidimicrobiales bacterium]
METVMDNPWDYDDPHDELEEDLQAAEAAAPGARAQVGEELRRRQLAHVLAGARRSSGTSLERAAAHLGVSPAELRAAEEADASFSLDELATYATALGLGPTG